MKTIKILILVFAVIIVLVTLPSCKASPRLNVNHSFYYWKSTFEMNATDLADLRVLKINRLYIKFFDVVWDQGYGGVVPVSTVEYKTPPLVGMEIVPVVFITVEALERISPDQSNGLGDKIYKKINSILRRNRLGPVSEIQLDCDWNNAVRVKYFTILTRIKALAATDKTAISATIRLHQVKYAAQTGVPPTDKGMLMFYNFDSPKNPEVNNSILDLKVGMKYTSGLKRYPLQLDLALPLFSWGALFQDNVFQGLIGNLRTADLVRDSRFKKVTSSPGGRESFEALTDCSLNNIRIYKGDLIRVEESRFANLLASAKYLAGQLRKNWSGGLRFNVSLFYFDHNLIQGVGGCEKIMRLYNSFR